MDQAVEILLVEDNPHDVELTLYSLKKYNIANDVKIIRDGEEAMDYIFCTGDYRDRAIEDTPKVIFLDLKLPKIDGIEILKRIKNDDRTKYIPVVVLTSSHEEKDLLDSYNLGVNSYIVKPVDFKQFSDAIRQLGLYWLVLNKRPGDCYS